MTHQIKETEYRCFKCGKTLLLVDDDKVYCDECGTSRSLEDYLEIRDIFMEAGIINEDGDVIDQEDYNVVYTKNPDDERSDYCKICDGPYPNCTTSCTLFDD